MKSETDNQLIRRKKQEAKQLQELEKESKRAEGKYYLLMLMVVLTIIYVVDELASNMNGAMQPYVILDFFKLSSVLDEGYAPTVATLTVFVTVPSVLMMLIGPFYKSLADKYGRKLFLILNTTIMGLGLLVCMVAPSIVVYVIGILMVMFVQSNDMQVMYVMETAPAKHRAKLCSVTKAIALVGVSLIGVSRKIFYNPEVPSSWRYVFLIPAILGIAVGLGCIPFIRETPVFRTKRMEYLKLSDEERALLDAKMSKEKESSKESSNKGGVINAIKFIFSTPQLRYATIAGLVFCLSTGITSYYTTILEASTQAGVITSSEFSDILIIFPFINGITTFACGFISDSLGRKKGCLAITSGAVVSLVGFILGAILGWSAPLIGIFYGLFIGCLWSVSDTIILVIPSESTPTELRASVVGTLSLFSNIAMFLSIVLVIVGMNIVGAANLGLFCLFTAVPFLVVAIMLLLTKVRETAGDDLNSVEQ